MFGHSLLSRCFKPGPAPNPAGQPAPAAPNEAASAAQQPPASAELADLGALRGYLARVVGCVLGKMCGDVLGAAVEGWDQERVLAEYPDGMTCFRHTERGFGCYTDDTQMALALTRSLLACGGRCDPVHAARCYAEEYEPHRGYGGTAHKVLQHLCLNPPTPELVATISARFLPGGSFGNGGAMRIAPLGLAYRHAPPAALRAAVEDALRVTHTHPVAVDGAYVVALAVGWLATHGSDPGPGSGSGCGQGGTQGAAAEGGAAGGPAALLGYLLAPERRRLLATEGMGERLEAVRDALAKAPHLKSAAQPWRDYFAGPGWAAELAAVAAVSEPFQIRADDAAAAALAALCWHWWSPADAVTAAVHYGGDTDTIAAIVGALAGALHGCAWLPGSWWGALENGPQGRDAAVALALQLAQLDAREG